MKTKLLTTAVCGVLAFGLAGQARAQLVTDGTFQVGTGLPGQLGFNGTSLTDWSYSAPENSYDFVYNSATITTGLTGEHGNVALYGPSGPIPGGGNALGIDPVFQNGGAAGSTTSEPVYQTVNGLQAGSVYALTFSWAASQQTTFSGDTTEWWQASLGAQTQNTTTYSNASGASSSWMQTTLDFTATSSSEVLSFIAGATPGIPSGGVSGDPPFCLLTDVSLTETTSAPDTTSTMTLLGIAVSAMGFAARFRRQTRKASQEERL